MSWARRSLIWLFSALLLVSFLGFAGAVSANLAFSHPARVENWLDQSNLYGNFAGYVTEQALKTTGSGNVAAVSTNNPAVKQAAQSVFSTGLLKQSVNTFLDSNYAWLRGETGQPSFVIDLTSAKQSFAKQIGQQAKDHLNSLPGCTPEQQAQLTAGLDPFTVTCRPAGLNPDSVRTELVQEITGSGDFLSNPVITAQNFNPKGKDNTGHPYYEKLSKLPAAYRLSQKLPLIFTILGLISMLVIILAASARRQGIRRIGVLLALAGILLLLGKFLADYTFNKVESRAFNKASVGQIQQALVNFFHLAKNQVVKVDIYFAALFLIIAVVIFIYLFKTRGRSGNLGAPQERLATLEPGSSITPEDGGTDTSNIRLAKRPSPPTTDNLGGGKPKPVKPITRPPERKKPPRPPRLIQ